jgi:predicted DCC family thiol-disulfide oxidoreductase YuxK
MTALIKTPKKGIQTKALLLYDGRCGLCSRSVKFIMKRRRKDRFDLLAFQQYDGDFPPGRTLAPESVWLKHEQTWYSRSDAVLKTLIILGFPWNLAGILWIIPSAIRNAIYNHIATNRYKWFGTTDENCELPK